jgi:predicted nucleic acid-binding protein
MIFVDSSAWYAVYSLRDINHPFSARLIRTVRERTVTTDYVIDETLTLLRARHENERALVFGKSIIDERIATIVQIGDTDFSEAWNTFQRFQDKGWSFTDCTSRVVMQRLGIQRAFSFDDHFRQFGTVTVVP